MEHPEPITAESISPGTHAYVGVTMTLHEAIKLFMAPRIASRGDNVSPPLTLADAGRMARILVTDVDDTKVRGC